MLRTLNELKQSKHTKCIIWLCKVSFFTQMATSEITEAVAPVGRPPLSNEILKLGQSKRCILTCILYTQFACLTLPRNNMHGWCLRSLLLYCCNSTADSTCLMVLQLHPCLLWGPHVATYSIKTPWNMLADTASQTPTHSPGSCWDTQE